jgi:hypothetical protein
MNSVGREPAAWGTNATGMKDTLPAGMALPKATMRHGACHEPVQAPPQETPGNQRRDS